MRLLLALVLALACSVTQAQQAQLRPFQGNGNTITFTANTSGNIPAPVQATTPAGFDTQYLITNIGANVVFVAIAGTSAQATTNCVIPTGTSQPVIPVLNLSQITVTAPANSWFCGITSASTSVVYVTPGAGQ